MTPKKWEELWKGGEWETFEKEKIVLREIKKINLLTNISKVLLYFQTLNGHWAC